MAYSSERKKALVGWSCMNADSFSNVQVQKFLFFYECFSKIEGDAYELDGLKGYRNGPVFSAVFGDIRHEQDYWNYCKEAFLSQPGMVNDRRAKLSAFLVKSLGNKLSEFTHMLNIWAAKRAEIEKGAYQVPLDEDDFSEGDAAILKDIERAYPENYLDSIETKNIHGKAFVIRKADLGKLDDRAYDAMNEAAYDPEFDTPVYVSLDETGDLLLD